MIYNGYKETTEALNLVADYLEKKKLSKMGYTFDGNELTDVDYQIYSMIDNEFKKLEAKEIEKNGAKHRTKNSR